MYLGEVVSSVLGKNSFRVPITFGKICVGEWCASFSDCRFNLDDLSFMFFFASWAGWGPLAVSIAATGLALLAGALTFRRLERRVLKEL